MTRAMKGLQGFADLAAAAFGKVLNVMERLIPVAQLVVDIIGKFATTATTVVGAAAESFTMLVVAISTATVALITFVKFMDELGLGQLTIIGQFRNIATALQTMKDGFSSVVSFVGSIPSSIGSAVGSVFGLFGSASDGAKQLGEGGKEAAQGLAARFGSAMSSAASNVKRAFSAMTSAAVSFAQSVGRAISTATSYVVGFVQAGLSIPNRLAPALATAGDALTSLGSKVTGPLTEAGKQFGAAGTAAALLAASTGLSVRSVTELGYAAEQSGASVETVASAVESVNTKLLEAAAGSQSAAAGFEQLGFDVDNLSKIGAEDRFLALGVAIAKIESPLDRAAAASKVFGTSNQSLVSMFSKGTAGINEMRKEAERLGLVMTGPQAAAAKALTAAYQSIQDALTGLWRTLGAAVAPQLTETATQMSQIIKAATAWVAKNGALIAQLFKWASVVTSIGAALSGAATLFAMLTPAVLTLSATLAAGWLAWGKWGQSAAGALQSVQAFMGRIMAEVGRVVGGVKDAIAGGDLELAVKVAWAGVQKAWTDGLTAMSSLVGPTMAGIFDSLASGNWSDAIGQTWNAIQGVFTAGVGALDNVWTGLTGTIDSVITYLRQQINVAIQEIAKLAIAGLQQANALANLLAKYDPTGKIREGQVALGKSLKGSAFVKAAGTAPDAANAALGLALGERQAGREAGLAGREAGRTADLDRIRLEQMAAQDKAAKDAAQAKLDRETGMQDLLGKARAARDAAAIRPIADLERRDKLAAAAGAAPSANGGFGATFSAAAMVAQQGGGGLQSQIAKATQASAKSLQALVESDKKRRLTEQALQIQVTA